jgi:hypothetical protein
MIKWMHADTDKNLCQNPALTFCHLPRQLRTVAIQKKVSLRKAAAKYHLYAPPDGLQQYLWGLIS